MKRRYIYLVRNRISTWRNKTVIHRYCVILSNAFARYLSVCVQLTRCTYTRAFWYTCVSVIIVHVETTAVIRVIVYGFNNGLMGNRLHCRIRQITSITNTTVARLVFTTHWSGAQISLCWNYRQPTNTYARVYSTTTYIIYVPYKFLLLKHRRVLFISIWYAGIVMSSAFCFD